MHWCSHSDIQGSLGVAPERYNDHHLQVKYILFTLWKLYFESYNELTCCDVSESVERFISLWSSKLNFSTLFSWYQWLKNSVSYVSIIVWRSTCYYRCTSYCSIKLLLLWECKLATYSPNSFCVTGLLSSFSSLVFPCFFSPSCTSRTTAPSTDPRWLLTSKWYLI